MRTYVSSQNNTHITHIYYRKLWEIVTENYWINSRCKDESLVVNLTNVIHFQLPANTYLKNHPVICWRRMEDLLFILKHISSTHIIIHKHKIHISYCSQNKTQWKANHTEKKPDIINYLEKMNTMLLSAMAKGTICTISRKDKKITDCAKLETPPSLWP
jgi:hypothetical protein